LPIFPRAQREYLISDMTLNSFKGVLKFSSVVANISSLQWPDGILQEKVVRMVLDRGADFKLVDRVSWTLLYFAGTGSPAAIVELAL